MTIYILEAPLAYVRSSRALYTEIRDGVIKPGEYILVDTKYLTHSTQPRDMQFLPMPRAPYFEEVMHVQAEDPMVLYRVLPGADKLPLPATPVPPPILVATVRYRLNEPGAKQLQCPRAKIFIHVHLARLGKSMADNDWTFITHIIEPSVLRSAPYD